MAVSMSSGDRVRDEVAHRAAGVEALQQGIRARIALVRGTAAQVDGRERTGSRLGWSVDIRGGFSTSGMEWA